MKRAWTKAEAADLQRLYPDMPTADVAVILGRSLSAVQNRAHGMRLSKSEAFRASEASGRIRAGVTPSGARSSFPKDGKPWNTGLKGVNGTSSTRFASGNKPHTLKPVGAEKLDKDGNLVRKVSETGKRYTDWISVARIVWEAANGPTPAGHIVVFKHGLKTAVREQITLDRVECITRAENVTRNHPRYRNPELGRLVQLKGAINRQANRIAREAQETAA